MKKIFVINAGQKFEHSGGEFNLTLTNWTVDYFKQHDGYEIKTTDINETYDLNEEVEKFVWADVVIYHIPIWWFQVPFRLKEYLDKVFTEGQDKGIYVSDGRHRINLTRNYGTGGSKQGTKYMLTTTWNAPEDAFTIEGEFFNQHSVDEGVMFGFHRMNAFIGMSKLDSFHFYDVMKNPNIEYYKQAYLEHLDLQVKSL